MYKSGKDETAKMIKRNRLHIIWWKMMPAIWWNWNFLFYIKLLSIYLMWNRIQIKFERNNILVITTRFMRFLGFIVCHWTRNLLSTSTICLSEESSLIMTETWQKGAVDTASNVHIWNSSSNIKLVKLDLCQWQRTHSG